MHWLNFTYDASLCYVDREEKTGRSVLLKNEARSDCSTTMKFSAWVIVQVILGDHLTALHGDYVPLNSLTLTKLYQNNESSESSESTEKTWWTDLQEKREEYKAKRKKMKEQFKQNGSLASTLLSDSVSEVPIPFKSQSTTTISNEELVQNVPFPSGTTIILN